ncbi:hypothetical protein BDR26DRAFT_925300 [Obelidium mucronatum]|nr:hypothetical protein BDR26DRAFT_925300 [Obelidium mucronatum]
MRSPDYYGCTGWDGTGLQYLQSSLCGYFVGMGVAYGPEASSSSSCNRRGTVVPLCKQTMDSFIDSWDSVFADPIACPNGVNDYSQSFIGYVRQMSQYMAEENIDELEDTSVSLTSSSPSSSSSCIVAESMESENCGFKTENEARRFCSRESSEFESCCTSYYHQSGSSIDQKSIDTTIASFQEQEQDSAIEVDKRETSALHKKPRFICVQVE